MKFKKVDEWEDHRVEPGGDEIILLEAVDSAQDHLYYTHMSFSELTDEQFDALERGETIDLAYPGEPIKGKEKPAEQSKPSA